MPSGPRVRELHIVSRLCRSKYFCGGKDVAPQKRCELVTVLFAINLLWRLSVEQATSTPRGPSTLSIAGVVILMRSGHLGGELVYHYGTGRRKR